MCKVFLVDGYFKDDGDTFTGYKIKESNDINPDDDDDIFYYGMSENDIKENMAGNSGSEDFIITAYEVLYG